MLLRELKCPGCGAPIKAKARDMMLKCSHCDRISLYSKEKSSLVDVSYVIAGASKESKGVLVYVPFWVVNANLDVRRERISGGMIMRTVTGQKQMRGTRDFYVCAADEIPEKYSRDWNMDLTLDQPELNPVSDFKGADRAKMTMDKDVAGENAEFLFLRYETEIPGTLQDLDYVFDINSTRVVYLPVWKDNTSYTIGI